MADPLELEVQPEKSIGTGNWEFSLGMPLVHVIQILKTQLHVLKHADVIFSQCAPLEGDLHVDLRENGLLLKFDSYSQRLKLIDVYDVSMVTLKYNNNEFSSRETPATNTDIMRSFGQVYKKPVADSKLKCQLLSWPGITFAFSMLTDIGSVHSYPSTTPPLHSSGFSSSPSAGQALLQDSALPLKKVLIYCGENYQEAESPPIPSSCFHGNCYADSVDVLMQDSTATQLSVSLLWTGSAGSNGVHRSPRHDKAKVCFNGTTQDVLSSLGAPSNIFYKAEDKMRIHLKKEQKQLVSEHSDYFFNYFTLGMDVLFDAVSHRVKKFVLHTNFPGHYNFGMYHRCNFVIRIPASGDGAEKKVTPYSKWSELHLSNVEEEPYLLRRNPSTNVVNPFGSSQCYGHKNFVFEVMENGYIASVTIFSHVH